MLINSQEGCLDYSNEQLMARIAVGNRSAFEALYQQTSAKLLPVLLQLVQDRASAEDLLQETYLRVWHQADRYNPDKSAAYTWIYTIARNLALDSLRRRSRSRKLPVDDDSYFSEPVAGQRTLENMEHCLQQLQSEQRQALVMSYCYGYQQAEIVALLERPLGTVKSWLRRGMEFMQQCLSH